MWLSRGGRWVPLELDPVNAGEVLGEWRWVVDTSDSPPIAAVQSDTTGLVYVDHRQTCGAGAGPKHHCEPYLRRWEINKTKLNAGMENETVRAANDLRALQRRLRGDDREA